MDRGGDDLGARDLAREARTAVSFIAVVGWEKFQHYKDRDPPWVKLYRDLLTSESWVLGTDVSRLVQVASVLLAARYSNKIPYRWDLIKKVASLDCTEAQFKSAIQHLAEHNFIEIQQVTSEQIVVEHSASTPLATCTSEAEQRRGREETEQRERETRARASPEGVPRGAVIDGGSRLTAQSAYGSLLEDWRRDVPECNPDAFAKWIVHVEESGKPMTPAMRLAQAKRLAGNGDFDSQLEVVTYCAENGYKTLIPIADVRHRTRGRADPQEKPKLTWRPPPDEEPTRASG